MWDALWEPPVIFFVSEIVIWIMWGSKSFCKTWSELLKILANNWLSAVVHSISVHYMPLNRRVTLAVLKYKLFVGGTCYVRLTDWHTRKKRRKYMVVDQDKERKWITRMPWLTNSGCGLVVINIHHYRVDQKFMHHKYITPSQFAMYISYHRRAA